mgnify:FL=1
MLFRSMTVRVVLIGDSQVGKTSLVQRFVRSSFEKQQRSTIGAVFHTYERSYNGTDVVMQIWDTAGQEKYRSLGPIYYRNSVAGICVFDMTNKETLSGLEKWISEFRKQTNDPILYIVGNKIDIQDKITVTEEEAKAFSKSQNAKLIFSSAKTGENVQEIFESIFQDLGANGKFEVKKELAKNEDKGNSCC